MQVWGPVSDLNKTFSDFKVKVAGCLVFVFSVVPQEELPARSEGASAESRVQAEQDPLLHHHDGLQPKLLLCREGRLTQ